MIGCACLQAPGWPSVPAACRVGKSPAPLPTGSKADGDESPAAGDNGQQTALGGTIERAVRAACKQLIAAAGDLDALDQK